MQLNVLFPNLPCNCQIHWVIKIQETQFHTRDRKDKRHPKGLIIQLASKRMV